MKKIFLLMVIILLVLLIYILAYKNKKLSFAIGDNNSDINYNPSDYRITDIIIDIENNINIGNYKIQHLLVKATTININLDKYISSKDYQSIIKQIDDLECLYKLLKIYSKEEIKVKLLKGKNDLINYANRKIIVLSKKYDIMIVR